MTRSDQTGESGAMFVEEGPMVRTPRRHRQRGAAAVEFALVLPLLITLVFGIMEAGWFFAQQVEIRNAAREGARLAVTDYGSASAVIAETCDRVTFSGSGATITIALGSENLGADSVSVTIDKAYTSLTGFITFLDGPMSTTATMRTEQTLESLSAGTGVCS